MIDEVDHAILTILQANARTPAAEIARSVGMAPSAVFERLRKLEDRRVIRGYAAAVDPHVFDLGLLAFISVRADGVADDALGRRIAEIPGVQEVHHVAGEDCFLVKVRCRDPEALGRLLRDHFGPLPAVRSTRSTIVLGTIKETATLMPSLRAGPVGADAGGGETTTAPAEGPEERHGRTRPAPAP